MEKRSKMRKMKRVSNQENDEKRKQKKPMRINFTGSFSFGLTNGVGGVPRFVLPYANIYWQISHV